MFVFRKIWRALFSGSTVLRFALLPYCRWHKSHFPANIHMLRINDRNIRKRCELFSKLTRNTPEQRQWRRSGVFILNFEYISHLFAAFLWLTLNMYFFGGFNQLVPKSLTKFTWKKIGPKYFHAISQWLKKIYEGL